MIRRALWIACLGLLLALPARADEAVRLGVIVYDGTDTFISSMRTEFEEYAAPLAELIIHDSHNDQNQQIQQVDQLIAQNVDAIILNPVDRTAAGYLIEIARAADVPIVFYNREPLLEDMQLYDKAYYVGARATESGQLSGEIMADYFLAHPEADKNGDGIVQYVLLRGEPGHQDAELRSQYAIKPLQDAGFQLEKLQEDTGNWQRALAQDKMAGFLAADGDAIECVFANNDDMALGAIDALKAAGYFTEGRYMPVVGMDATAPALEALRSGSLLGTVYNDGVNQARACVDLAMLLANGLPVDEGSLSYPLENGKYIWIPYQRVTLEGVDP